MNGARLASGDELRTSVMAKIRKTRIAVPMIWSRRAPHSCTGKAAVAGQRGEHALGLDGVAGVELAEHLGVVPAHHQRGHERAGELGERVRHHLAPGEAARRPPGPA